VCRRLRRCIVEDLRPASEERTEHVSEALAHRAIDEEVEWIGDCDAAINEQRGRVSGRVTE